LVFLFLAFVTSSVVPLTTLFPHKIEKAHADESGAIMIQKQAEIPMCYRGNTELTFAHSGVHSRSGRFNFFPEAVGIL
jgi:hypothetical protein